MKPWTRIALLAWIIACATMMPNLSAYADLEDPQPYKGFPQLSPEINNYTGSAAQRIPIAVPPGRLGLQPNLAFTYNSYKRSGIMGTGWELEPGEIQRRTKWGVHYDRDEFDIVMNGQKSELVPIGGMPDYFRARIESDFYQYHFVRSGDYWEVIQSGGTRYCFGYDPHLNEDRNARQSNDLGTFKWCLAHVRDTNGNYMTIDYLLNQGRVYPEYINYTGGMGAVFTHRVEFNYESADRPDPQISYASKSGVTTALRLESVKTYASDTPALEYRLEYEQGAVSQNSLLKRIRIIGSDGLAELPGYTFNYQAGDLGGYGDITGVKSIPLGNDSDTNRTFADINGDNKDDLILVGIFGYNGNGGTVSVYPSNGDGTFGNPITSSLGGVREHLSYRSGTPYSARYQSNHFADINGDARPDLVQYNYKRNHDDNNSWVKVNQIRIFTANEDSTFSPGQVIYLEGDNTDFKNGLLCVGDLNSDGYADIYFGGRDETFQNDGQGNFTEVASPSFPGAGAYARYLVDINGDGVTDLVNYHYERTNVRISRAYSTYLADGRGGFVYANIQRFENLFPGQVFNVIESQLLSTSFSDVNNDGRPDLIIKAKRNSNDTPSFQTWLSDGYGTFTLYETKSGRQETTIADLNGDGVGDLIEIRHVESALDNGNIVVYENYIKSSISQNVIPYDLMSDATSPGGVKISFTYNRSSDVGNHLFLPFLMYPVDTVSVDDGVRSQPSVTAYVQELGYYDAAEKENRGFELSTRTRPDGTVIQTYHFVGLENHPDYPDYPNMPDDCSQDNYYLNGRVRQVDLFDAPGGNLISRTRYQWRLAEHPADGWAFVKPAQKRTEYYDDQTVFIQEDYVYDVDQYGLTADSAGLLKKVTASGTGAYEIVTENDHINCTSDPYAPMWRKTLEKVYENGQSGSPARHTQYIYNSTTGNLEQKIGVNTDPDVADSVWRYQYHGNGNLQYEYDANGNPPTQYVSYDDTETYPTLIRNPAGHETQKEWDTRWGLEDWVTDPNGQTTDFTYDAFGRLTRTDLPDQGCTRLIYSDYCTGTDCNNVGLPRQVRVEVRTVGSQTEDTLFYFDGLARKVQTAKTGEAGNYVLTKIQYDNMGRPGLEAGPFFRSSNAFWSWDDYSTDGYTPASGLEYPYVYTLFDQRGRPYIKTGRDGQNGLAETTYAYSGFETTVTDPDGCVKTEIRDHLDRIREVVEDPSGEDIHTHYSYNAAGDLLTVYNAAEPMASRIQIQYDSLGRKIRMDDPDMGQWTYAYYPNGELELQTDAKGSRIQYFYDDLNRLETKDYLDTAEPTVSYTYDSPDTFLGVGRLSSISNGHVTTAITAYDAMGRRAELQKTISGAATRTMSWDYDYAGRVLRLTYPHTDASPLFYVDYAFHPGTELLHTATGPAGTVYAAMTGYQPSGKIGTLDFGNNVRTTYGYDGWSQRLTSIDTAKDQGAGDKHQDRLYSYSKAGDIEQIDDQAWVETYYYSYDKLHRLTSETTSTGSLGVIPGIYEMQYDDPDHIHAVSSVTTLGTANDYTYDANGNMTAGPDLTDVLAVVQRSLAFNADNMPTSVAHPAGGTVTITYDGEAKRAKKSGPNGTTYYFSKEFELIGTTETCYVFAGNLRVAIVKDYTNVTYFHKDHLGSSSVVTDANGDALEQTRYMPFGGKRGDEVGILVSNYLFTDQELDKATGFYNYDARMYDPIVSNFISPDPIIQNVYDPQYLSRFCYTRNNPLIYTDPTGRSTAAPTLGVIGGPPAYYETPEFTDMRVKSTVQAFKAINRLLDKIAYELRKAIDPKFAAEAEAAKAKNEERPDAPPSNDGKAKPHGNPDHDGYIDNRIDELKKDPNVSDVRKNQQQADKNNKKVSTKRPDIQYNRNNPETNEKTHYNEEVDRTQKNSDKHLENLKENDPEAVNIGHIL